MMDYFYTVVTDWSRSMIPTNNPLRIQMSVLRVYLQNRSLKVCLGEVKTQKPSETEGIWRP